MLSSQDPIAEVKAARRYLAPRRLPRGRPFVVCRLLIVFPLSEKEAKRRSIDYEYATNYAV